MDLQNVCQVRAEENSWLGGVEVRASTEQTQGAKAQGVIGISTVLEINICYSQS